MADEVFLGILAAILINGAFDAIVVAWIAAQRSPGAFDKWIQSNKAKPALHVIATHVREEVLPDLPKNEDLRLELDVLKDQLSVGVIQPQVNLIRKELATAIDQVRADMGRMHAELSAEMPPNIDGR